MVSRRLVLFLLFISVASPIVLFTDRLGKFTPSSADEGFGEEISSVDSTDKVNEPLRIVYLKKPVHSLLASEENTGGNDSNLRSGGEHKSRVLSAAEVGDEESNSEIDNHIHQITEKINKDSHIQQVTNKVVQVTENNEENIQEVSSAKEEDSKKELSSEDKTDKREEVSVQVFHSNVKVGQADKDISKNMEASRLEKDDQRSPVKNKKQSNPSSMDDLHVRQIRDQLIRARVYQSIGQIRSNSHFIRELRLRVKELQRALGDATKDSELPKNVGKGFVVVVVVAYEKMKAMEQTLQQGEHIPDDCSIAMKKLRALVHSTEEQLRVHKKQAMFLTQLAAKTLPKGFHCLPLRLATEYYALNPSEREFPDKKKLEDFRLYHYALFSDNILAASVVVNSTITHAKDPEKHVFHVVTDKLNYAAMRMWFLANPPGKATIEVQSVNEFTWLNSSYSLVLKQLSSSSMIDYYFRSNHANSDSNLKFRNPKYLSILNHLRFYLPEIFPKLHKMLFLDDDIVVQKDLTALWTIDLKGMINGAVETCQESFHRFDKYLNFSNPLIANNFSPRACGWAYGMNIFDLEEWKRQKITDVYHSWQNLNHERQLWKLGTLPPGLVTFWKRTLALDKGWHVLGLGYNPDVEQEHIARAAVIHYNGNMKPWLEIGLPQYRSYWSKYVDYDQVYLRDCNINP